MYYAVSRLDADKFANLDFIMNFGVTAEYKVLFTTFISGGGSYEQAKKDIFEPTPPLMLLKLHNYFNWADKKLHTAFFIENKDCINEDLLADFKEGSGIEINPGLATLKPKAPEHTQKKGFMQKEMTFKDNADILRSGVKKQDIVDVTSHQDFPTLGASPLIQEAQMSKRGEKKQTAAAQKPA